MRITPMPHRPRPLTIRKHARSLRAPNKPRTKNSNNYSQDESVAMLTVIRLVELIFKGRALLAELIGRLRYDKKSFSGLIDPFTGGEHHGMVRKLYHLFHVVYEMRMQDVSTSKGKMNFYGQTSSDELKALRRHLLPKEVLQSPIEEDKKAREAFVENLGSWCAGIHAVYSVIDIISPRDKRKPRLAAVLNQVLQLDKSKPFPQELITELEQIPESFNY